MRRCGATARRQLRQNESHDAHSDRAARVDRPDVDQRVAVDHVVHVVQIHGRVAVRRDAFERSADRQMAWRFGELDAAVLVAEEVVFGASGGAAGDYRPRAIRRAFALITEVRTNSAGSNGCAASARSVTCWYWTSMNA